VMVTFGSPWRGVWGMLCRVSCHFYFSVRPPITFHLVCWNILFKKIMLGASGSRLSSQLLKRQRSGGSSSTPAPENSFMRPYLKNT
jgi:hypothetical protein